MAEVEQVASVPMPPCALAAGSHGGFPFLAAGPTSGHANSSAAGRYHLHLLQANPTTGLLPSAPTFWSPAGFCSLDWSNPTDSTCWRSGFSTGLIAAGLDNGVVAIWDPCTKLGDVDSGSSSSILPNYFTPKPSVPFDGVTVNVAATSSYPGTTSDSDSAQLPIQGLESENNLVLDEGESEAKWYPSRAECILNESHFLPADLQKVPLPHNYTVDVVRGDYSDALALLCSHSGPVHGLSFSPQQPNFLSSGSTEGQVVVWDIAKPSQEATPTLKFATDENVGISHLSWSPLLSKVIASASDIGTTLWDVSAKPPLIKKLPLMTGCSHVEWSPRDKSLMVVAVDLCDLPAVKVWDLRKMEHPVFQFCEKNRGVLSLSWSPFDSDILVGCTNNEAVVVLNVKKGEVVHEEPVGGKCFDICWSTSMEDHFAVSSSKAIDLFYRAPEI